VKPKILTWDIETAPAVGYLWGLFNQNIGISAIEEPPYTLCWSARWLGKKKMMFSSVWTDGRVVMLQKIHNLLDEADMVISFNGMKFDTPTLNAEFLKEEMHPPAPFAEIDLYRTCKGRFRFLSNKLDFVVHFLGDEGKIPNKGMELWKGCMREDRESCREMTRYNKQDVVITEKLYHKLKPWIQPHPNMGIYGGIERQCPNCGGTHLQVRGKYLTMTTAYRRLQCMECGKWSRVRTHDLDQDKMRNMQVGIK